MTKGKIALSAIAVIAGLAVVYIFFFSSPPAGARFAAQPAQESPRENAVADPAAAKAGDAVAPAGTDVENTALRGAGRERRAAEPQHGPTFLGTAAELFFYLVLIAALVVGLLIFLKKILPGGHRIFDTTAIEVVGRAHLAPKQSIYLARLGRRVLVIGLAENSVSLLTEIQDLDEINAIMSHAAQAKSESVTNAFRSVFGHREKELAAPPGAKNVEEELGKIQSMLDNWKNEHSALQ